MYVLKYMCQQQFFLTDVNKFLSAMTECIQMYNKVAGQYYCE